ncbi:VOC family protein [Microvirga yunnanensis]|uniref:VOC family protein n=1 Tax=Microvirga yunnanensis TaxID=2953740 RepID=UPI0021C8262E|nr:VOC family protein [Microvirga sp. HBU65207]
MPTPNFILLYVDSPAASADFYGELLQRKPVEASPTFVLFALGSGLMLGLWSRHTVQPAAAAPGGGTELAFPVERDGDVDAACAAWKARGLSILQEPTVMDFGRTFVALDPDNHRLRVFAPAAR